MQSQIIDELEKQFKEADATDSFSALLSFGKCLTASDEPEIIEYHFNLFQRAKNKKKLHSFLVTFFERRRDLGRDYLLRRISTEQDPFLIATSLQILGHMRCPEVLALARGFITDQEALVREWACIVLGWVGTAQEIELLGKVQINETDCNTRKWAATQQMHIWLRFPDVKNAVVANLRVALEQEAEPEVLEMILYTAEQVLKRRFGLKRDPESPYGRMLGDLQEAKRRAAIALKNSVQRAPKLTKKK